MNVVEISLKRLDGTPAELARFKRGFRVRTFEHADATLREWASTMPEGENHRVAYYIEFEDGSRHYGTIRLAPNDETPDLMEFDFQLNPTPN